MKKIKKIFLLLILITFSNNVNALTVEKNNITIPTGEEKEITLSADVGTNQVTKISFTLTYNSYDFPASFKASSGLNDEESGIKHTITFDEAVTGKIDLGKILLKVAKNPQEQTSSISLSNATAITTLGTTITLNNQIITVKVGESEEETTKEEPTEKTDNNLLKSIDSNIVNIKLEKDIFEYTVKIKEDIEELDLKPIPNKEDYKITISNQKIKELKDNKIEITVKTNDNIEQKYIINIEIEKEKKKVTTAKKEEKTDNNYKTKWTTLAIICIFILLIGLIINKKK